jgi:hypothetical protein
LASTPGIGVKRALTAYAFVAFIGAFALVGAALAAGIAFTRSDHTVASVAALSAADDLGRELRTSFGALTVVSVQQIRGLSPKELAGFTHFPSYVPPDKMQVRVSLQLSNLLPKPVRYSAGQFRLRVGDGPRIAPSRVSMRSGTLEPSAAVDQTFSFVVSRTNRRGTQLVLEFRDRGGDPPLIVRLGTVRAAAAPLQTLDHDHTGHGRSP